MTDVIGNPTSDALRKAGIPPWEVGTKDAIYTATIKGEITAIDTEAATMTIGGHTVPTRLGGTVRVLSMIDHPINEDDDEHGVAAYGDVCEQDHISDRAISGLIREIAVMHDDIHPGAFRFCIEPVCRAAREVA